MIIRQTTAIVFEYPQDYLQEQEWCKTKGDMWVHKSTDTLCSVYENQISYAVGAADRKTENSSEKPNNCEDKPQTCYTCEYEWRDSTDKPCIYCYNRSKYKPKDEPQKHCHRPNNVACHPEQGDMWCRGCDYWYANEPQTERNE